MRPYYVLGAAFVVGCLFAPLAVSMWLVLGFAAGALVTELYRRDTPSDTPPGGHTSDSASE